MGLVLVARLADAVVLVPLGGNLWQVSNTDDLGLGAEAPQQVANHLGHCTTNAHVHFIKHQAWHFGRVGSHHLNRQADAG